MSKIKIIQALKLSSEDPLFLIKFSQFPMNLERFFTCQKAVKQKRSLAEIDKQEKNVIEYSIMDFASNKRNAAVEMRNWLRKKSVIQFIELMRYRFWCGLSGWIPKILQAFWVNWNSLIESPAILTIKNKLIPHQPS